MYSHVHSCQALQLHPVLSLQNAQSNSQLVATCSILQTAEAATQLSAVSQELKVEICSNQRLVTAYSQKLLHVQSLAAQLTQMQQAGLIASLDS